MTSRRRAALLVLSAIIAVAAAVLLRRVLATVFFALTVASVLVPLYQWLRRRGLPGWWASTVATVAAFLAAVVLFLPVAGVLYLRREEILAVLDSLPGAIPIEVAGFTYVLDTGEGTALIAEYLTSLALSLVRAAPELAAHATVFAFVIFGVLLGRSRLRRALLLPIPPGFHDIAEAFHRRVRGTLFALYVIQAATALGTFVVALVVFWSLGYSYPATLAVAAGLLQFLPVVGPSLLVIGVAVYEITVGDVIGAALVLILGLLFIGFLPDAVIRPRLARETAGLPASLYFVGFTGGLLSLGPVGIIAGPLVIALLVESLSLLAREVNGPADPTLSSNPGEGPPRE